MRSHDYDLREILWPPCWRSENILHLWQVVLFENVISRAMPSFCLVVGCSNHKKKNPGLCFCRVPNIVTNQGEETDILSTERRTRWLAAISRADLTEKILENDRVCGIHFHSGKAAQLWDRLNPDWVPRLHLGHDKLKESDERKEQ